MLSVAPGDRIITTTVDAFGRDASGEQVTRRGNPLTGPFFVEGAEPRDTLVVTLDRIRPNRDHGRSQSSIVPKLVDPTYVAELPPRDPVDWSVDVDGGTATLPVPGATPAEITVAIEPMLGCIGVAPLRGQAISSISAGVFGGNMDYRGFVSGVTVYLPVFVPGALLFVGDGHAVQGDGEIVATGIEISMDVELTIDVRKGQSIGSPRGENERHIFTAGVAMPFELALQQATTEMLKWLQADYGLSMATANHLMGQVVEYDLGSVFNYTIVCKIAKAALPAPRVQD